MRQIIQAAILAGGLGTRLRSVVADRPKVLAQVGNQPFLTRLLDRLVQAGVDSVILCTGYLGEQVKETLGETYQTLQLFYSQELSPLGTAGALRLALPQVTADTLLVMNGDSYCTAKLEEFYHWHREKKSQASLLLTQVSDTRRYGRVDFDSDGRILKLVEKSTGETPLDGWINAGIYLFERTLLSTIPSGRIVSLEQEMFPQWIAQGLYGYCSSSRFLDIGTPESYATVEAFLSQESE